mmetsp:Transcript_1682/g.3675  ORF Transcript_1682/g.3675 Transcript_1682/m.3675 type:complete len:298 (+) Transcript_1682:650-1543(+)
MRTNDDTSSTTELSSGSNIEDVPRQVWLQRAGVRSYEIWNTVQKQFEKQKRHNPLLSLSFSWQSISSVIAGGFPGLQDGRSTMMISKHFSTFVPRDVGRILLLPRYNSSKIPRLVLLNARSRPLSPTTTGVFTDETKSSIRLWIGSFLVQNPQSVVKFGSAYYRQVRTRTRNQAHYSREYFDNDRTEVMIASPESSSSSGHVHILAFVAWDCSVAERGCDAGARAVLSLLKPPSGPAQPVSNQSRAAKHLHGGSPQRGLKLPVPSSVLAADVPLLSQFNLSYASRVIGIIRIYQGSS